MPADEQSDFIAHLRQESHDSQFGIFELFL